MSTRTQLKQRFKRWFSVDSHWQNLRMLFNPTLTRLFVSWFALAPLALKITGSLPNEITLTIEPPITLTLGLPFSWIALWWASLAYAIAFAIYSFCCPKFIKNNRNFTEYSQAGHSPRWLVWEFYYAWIAISKEQKEKLLKRVKEKEFAGETTETAPKDGKPDVLKNGTKFIFELGGKKYQINVDENLSDERQSELFWEIFARWASSNSVFRYIAWGLYYIAILITTWVVLQNIFFVLSRLFA